MCVGLPLGGRPFLVLFGCRWVSALIWPSAVLLCGPGGLPAWRDPIYPSRPQRTGKTFPCISANRGCAATRVKACLLDVEKPSRRARGPAKVHESKSLLMQVLGAGVVFED
jgi:hypothetical protein